MKIICRIAIKLWKIKNARLKFFKNWKGAALTRQKDADSACCRKVVELYLDAGNIPDAASFIVKYFGTAEKKFCTCPLCSPFQETKKVAKFFIDTPNAALVKLYGNDKFKAARAVFEFGQACRESPNISIHLEIISIAADILGGDCSKKILVSG